MGQLLIKQPIDFVLTGIHDADMEAKFGGPGASCRLTKFSQFCWATLEHAANGVNYFTKQKGTRLDFISFHKKGGNRGGPGSSAFIFSAELETIRNIRYNYKQFDKIPLYNDEGDPLKGWDFPLAFHATTAYPAMIVRSIHLHLSSTDPEFGNYHMLSNDNAFLSVAPHYFTQRTMVAVLSLVDSKRSATVLIRKPVYELTAMLAQVRDYVVTTPTQRHDKNATTGCLCTSTGHQVIVSCWVSNDTSNYTGGARDYVILMPSHMVGGYYIVRALVQMSTYETWLAMGSPGTLSQYQLEALWNVSTITNSKRKRVTSSIKIRVEGPGLTQMIACNQHENLSRPHSISFHTVSKRAVVIRWRDEQISDCFLTYQLEIKRTPQEDFIAITRQVILSRAYQFTSKFGVGGQYRVMSINIMGKTSEYSLTALYKT